MRAELLELRGLAEDWDSYGAVSITEAALKAADALAYVPTVNGGVQIELHAGGADIEIEIDERGVVESVFWGRA